MLLFFIALSSDESCTATLHSPAFVHPTLRSVRCRNIQIVWMPSNTASFQQDDVYRGNSKQPPYQYQSVSNNDRTICKTTVPVSSSAIGITCHRCISAFHMLPAVEPSLLHRVGVWASRSNHDRFRLRGSVEACVGLPGNQGGSDACSAVR